MKKIEVKMPEWLEKYIGEKCEPWEVEYYIVEDGPAKLFILGELANKSLMVVYMSDTGYSSPYYISSPSEGVAIERVGSLTESRWIINRLMARGLDAFDATTFAAVLSEHGNF